MNCRSKKGMQFSFRFLKYGIDKLDNVDKADIMRVTSIFALDRN